MPFQTFKAEKASLQNRKNTCGKTMAPSIYVLDLGTRVTSNPEHAGIYNGSIIATSPNNTFEGHLRSLMAFSQNSGGTIGVPKDPLDHARNSMVNDDAGICAGRMERRFQNNEYAPIVIIYVCAKARVKDETKKKEEYNEYV